MSALVAQRAVVARDDSARRRRERRVSRAASVAWSKTAASAGDDDLACLRRFLFTRRRAAGRACARRIAERVLGARRRARVGRDRATHPARSASTACASTRWRSSCDRRTATSVCSSTRLTRAGVPAWFDRGTRRPHPAGRAFLALLACAGESLSAARFAEYLSLGQVPVESASRDRDVGRAAGRGGQSRAVTGDGRSSRRVRVRVTTTRRRIRSESVAGTLRAPWRWEKLLVEDRRDRS